MKSFSLNRREWIKGLTASLAIGKIFSSQKAYSAGDCAPVNDYKKMPNSSSAITTGENLFYWFDGFMSPLLTGAETVSCRLSILIDTPQTSSNYLEFVSLVDSSNTLMSSQRFAPTDALSTGKAPYVIFDNINVSNKKSYTIHYLINKEGTSKAYAYTLNPDKIQQSRLDFAHLPPGPRQTIPLGFVEDMNQALHKFKNDTPAGNAYAHTAFQKFAIDHQIRFDLVNMDATGNFTFQIYQIHDDVDPGHYNRYFLVTDPVGRILGGVRRIFADPGLNPIARGTGPDGSTLKGMAISKGFKTSLTTPGGNPNFIKDMNDFANKLNINDCPHVLLFVDDMYNALVSTSFLLY